MKIFVNWFDHLVLCENTFDEVYDFFIRFINDTNFEEWLDENYPDHGDYVVDDEFVIEYEDFLSDKFDTWVSNNFEEIEI